MKEKKLYWQIDDNGDLSNTCESPEVCLQVLKAHFDDMELEDQEETNYTITPVWYTDEEYQSLPEA